MCHTRCKSESETAFVLNRRCKNSYKLTFSFVFPPIFTLFLSLSPTKALDLDFHSLFLTTLILRDDRRVDPKVFGVGVRRQRQRGLYGHAKDFRTPRDFGGFISRLLPSMSIYSSCSYPPHRRQ